VSEALKAKLAELERRFVEQAGEHRQAIAGAVAAGNRQELAERAHKLAGIAGMFGQPDIGAAALALEETAESGSDPQPAAARLIDLLGAL
jgi:HPt (histidine-containing phosphotransfer) domain-containing protein